MIFCDAHWQGLRDAIDGEGLGDLVAANGQMAAERLGRGFEGEDDWSTFEPLTFAMLNLTRVGSEAAGQSLFRIDGCPVCWLDEAHGDCPDPTCPDDYAGSLLVIAAESARRAWEQLIAEGVGT